MSGEVVGSSVALPGVLAYRSWARRTIVLVRRRLRGLGPLAALALACAGASAQRAPERPAAFARPEPDPACRDRVADSMRLQGIEQVTVRVALAGREASVELLAPELTPSQAAGVRRAFAGCAWLPGEGGATRGTVTFTRR